MPALTEKLAAALVDDPPLVLKEGGIFRDGFDPDLDEFRKGSREGKSWGDSRLAAMYSARQLRISRSTAWAYGA